MTNIIRSTVVFLKSVRYSWKVTTSLNGLLYVTNNEVCLMPVHSPWYYVTFDFVGPISPTFYPLLIFLLILSHGFTVIFKVVLNKL